VLDVDDIQGDVLLGFNKPFNVQLVFNLKEKTDDPNYELFKGWLKEFPCTTTRDVLLDRNKRRGKVIQPTVVQNISFGYLCLVKLLTGTFHEDSLEEFDSTSAFAVGARKRAPILGYDPDVINDWVFPQNRSNNDILINVAADEFDGVFEQSSKFIEETSVFLDLVSTTFSYRGSKTGPEGVFYGHEHFGFVDGLSQPEVRGTYTHEESESVASKTDGYKTTKKIKTTDGKIKFIVRRTIQPSIEDDRYKDYSRPGFRLLDPGHFLLGYLNDITDTNDGIMQNPEPNTYRKLKQMYPDWCKNGSFVVYTKIKQDVPGFWNECLNIAEKNPSPPPNTAGTGNDLKKIAGYYASLLMGRWWDGTPISCFPGPLSKLHYPPVITDANSNPLHNREGLLNGFNYDNETKPWMLRGRDGPVPCGWPFEQSYEADPLGKRCPFFAHVRKVNPRDEFTDIGSDVQTLKHRIIRRGNNYYGGANDSYASSRVKNVFDPTKAEMDQERGLALLMYNSSIEDQFEFVQRHWSNSSSRPRAGGDIPPIIGDGIDPIIGHKMNATVFTLPRGLGYFLLPSVSAIRDVICSSKAKVLPENILSAPFNNNDFKRRNTKLYWDWTLRTVFWRSIWATIDNYDATAAIPIPSLTRDSSGLGTMGGAGVAYRLPRENTKEYRQFYGINELKGIAKDHNKGMVFKIISWQGFPKRILDLFSNSNKNPYEYVEQLGWPSTDVTYRNYSSVPNARQMDEYCEWFTHRDPETNVISRIDITAESPEYFTFLFTNEPEVCLQLYQKYVSPLVKMDDLKNVDGSYNVYNKWNTTHGAMHLNCPPNSLFAEVYIAAEASTYWQKVGSDPKQIAVNGKDLIESSSYGLPTRASDPTIGYVINSLIQQDKIISISNPVGLYLEDLDTTGWTDKNGNPFTPEVLKTIVTYERCGMFDDGTKMNSRIRVEIPEDLRKTYGTLGECFIGGNKIDWAGRLIESSVTVFLRGAAIDGKGIIAENAKKVAIVPPKADWKVYRDGKEFKSVGPMPLFNPKEEAPEPPEDIYVKE